MSNNYYLTTDNKLIDADDLQNENQQYHKVTSQYSPFSLSLRVSPLGFYSPLCSYQKCSI